MTCVIHIAKITAVPKVSREGLTYFSLTEERSVANLPLYRETTETIYSQRTCRLKL